MIHWIQSSKNKYIDQYVECYWFIEKDMNSSSYDFPKLNPDPACHLILSPPTQTYQYDIKGDLTCGKGSHWLFPHHHTIELDHTDPFVHLGIKFHVGALYSLGLGEDIQLKQDQIQSIHIARLFEASDIKTLDLIEIARISPDSTCDQLDTLLRSLFQKSKEDKHSELVRKTLPLLANTPISALGDKLHCSQRTLERSFNRVTGLTLKQCQSMNKLELLLESLYQRDIDEIDWVEVAFEFGFSDQPHLIRHLKKQLGLTPSHYAKERGFTIDVYGGISS